MPSRAACAAFSTTCSFARMTDHDEIPKCCGDCMHWQRDTTHAAPSGYRLCMARPEVLRAGRYSSEQHECKLRKFKPIGGE